MESLSIIEKISWYYAKEFVEQIDPYIVMIHEDSSNEGDVFIMRFTNGFGVKILQLRLEAAPPSLFVAMVLRFQGARMQDYKLAQYSSIPEVNWLNGYEDIAVICRKVATLPAPRGD
jgi:hypothetical protein